MNRRFAVVDKFIAGIYCRLSVEDKKEGTSTSCEIQEKINKTYAKKERITVHRVYIDDGFTGTSFCRPDFEEMMNDLENGIINCIIVKDLSRLGRSNHRIGLLVDDFGEMGVRFIAVNDEIDTYLKEIDYTQFAAKNFVNGIYPHNVSQSTKKSFEALADDGCFLGAFPPYGYIKDPDNHYHLLQDPEVAHICTRIGNMYFQDRLGYKAIAKTMEREEIVCPAYYLKEKFPSFHIPSMPRKGRYGWTIHAVRNILTNATQRGAVVNFKHYSPTIKSKHRVKNDPSNWVVRENMHTANIEPEIQFQILKMIESKAKVCRSDERQIFAGLLYCPDCGSSLNQVGTRYKSYTCTSYKAYGKTFCSSHSISKNNLLKIVSMDINDKIKAMELDSENFIKKLIKVEDQITSKNLSNIKKRILEIKTRLDDISRIELELYEDKALRKITEEMYDRLSIKYGTEKDSLISELANNQNEIDTVDTENENAYKFVDLLKSYSYVTPETLDSDILNTLIDKIVVHQMETLPSGVQEQKVDIYYRGVGIISNKAKEETNKENITPILIQPSSMKRICA